MGAAGAWLPSPGRSLGRGTAVEYVMVPVPEELAARVLTYVSWKEAQATAAPPADEAPDAVAGDAAVRAFARLDAPSRALVAVVATAAL
jgi:hypothetical protein